MVKEQPMADEVRPPNTGPGHELDDLMAQLNSPKGREEPPEEPEAEQEQPESGARGILRQAIHKVMEKIEQHEQEAQKHLQQAAELRKELRDSLTYLHKQGEKGMPSGHAGKAAAPGTSADAKDEGAAGRHRRGKGKRKQARKSKQG
jgi:hypothetical protein